jgi:DNA-directed RNA polymerase specialized sigma24 family protein
MYDSITETYTQYEQACSKCIDDLYHTAYLVLVDADAAEKFVTEICVAGVHKYDDLEDEAEIRFRLTSDLYHRIKCRLWFCIPNTDTLPEQLQVLTKQERLIVAMRFSSGLSAAESGQILKLSEAKYRRLANGVIHKQTLYGRVCEKT